jgi:hypothetical protein
MKIGDYPKREDGDNSNVGAVVERVIANAGVAELPLLTNGNYHE